MPVEDELMVVRSEGWVTVLHGRVMMSRFADGDVGMRNLALVALSNTRLESKAVAAAFGLSATYVSILRGRVRDQGSAGLVRDQGRPVSVDAAGEAVAVKLAAKGSTQDEIAVRLGVNRSTVSRLLQRLAGLPVEPEQLHLIDPGVDSGDSGGCDSDADVDGHRPVLDGEGQAAGVRSCRYAGAALSFAFTDRVGFEEIFKVAGPAGYRYDGTALLTGTMLGLLLGAGNIEGFKHLNRSGLGALVGVDRFPTTRTLRARLAQAGDSVDAVGLQTRLAKALLAFDGPQFDLFFVDGHFVTYSGSAPLAKGWNNRRGRAEHGRDDTWVTDSGGRPLVCVSGEPAGLSRGLKDIIAPLRNVVGVHARPLLAFDRGGSYPSTFKALNDAGWDWVAYRRAPLAATAATPKLSWFAIDGKRHTYRCADETVELAGYGPARQITIFEAGEPVAQILTSVNAGVNARVIHLLRCRWRIENAFKYLSDHHGIDWLCDYKKTERPVTIEVDNPARAIANKTVAAATGNLNTARTRLGDITNRHVTDVNTHLADLDAGRDDIIYAQDQLAAAKAHRHTVPAKLHPEVIRAQPHLERRALQTALRICAHNTEHWLARQLDTHLQDPDQVRSHTRALITQPGIIDYQPDRIIIHQRTPRRPRRPSPHRTTQQQTSPHPRRHPTHHLHHQQPPIDKPGRTPTSRGLGPGGLRLATAS